MRKFIVTIDGTSYDVGVEEVASNGAVTPIISEIKTVAPVEKSPVEKAPIKKAVAAKGTKIESPMPGLVLELKVAEGATVKKDQVIIVLEAMKMANDLTAPCDGVISFNIAKGANVETGAILAVIA